MSVAFGFYRIHFTLEFSFYAAALAILQSNDNQHLPKNMFGKRHLIHNQSFPLKALQAFVLLQIYDSREECLFCEASPSVQPELSHALYLLTFLMILHAADRQVFIITFLKIVKFNLIIIIGLSDWIHLQARLREAASAGQWKGRSLQPPESSTRCCF